MDPLLGRAVRSGDVFFLRKALADCQANNDYSYFLNVLLSDDFKNGNFLHLLACNSDNRVQFCREAIETLPAEVVHQLLSPEDDQMAIFWGLRKVNPLHVAVYTGNLEIVKLFLGFYRGFEDSGGVWSEREKPWVAQDSKGRTPLHHALQEKEMECALEVVRSVDLEAVSDMDDDDGNGPLFLAVENGFTEVALEMLRSDHQGSVSGKEGLTPLHFVPNCSSEEVCRRLLEKHPQLLKARDNHGYTVMHTWADIGELWPFKFILNNNEIVPEWKSHFVDLILVTDEYGNNPLHNIIMDENLEIARLVVDAYKHERAKKASISSEKEPLPWLTQNHEGKTPLDLATLKEKREILLCFLSPEIDSALQGLCLALENQLYETADAILAKQNEYGWTSGRGRNVLHSASTYKEGVGKWLVAKFPSFISEKDEDGKTPLGEASKAGASWLIEAMLTTDSSSLRKAPLAWIEACKEGHLTTVLAFINNCTYFRDLCLETTPLHHIWLQGCEVYEYFLKSSLLIWELKNTKDKSGATPLHQAIRNDNIQLTEVLLTKDEVMRNIQDNTRKTATDLLMQVCRKSPIWENMCQRTVPGLKTTYFQDKTNLLEVRNTLSVVAALLATITFTAGFTLPGGFNGDTGEAILAKKAAFLVFLLADTYAMCCSMLVLVCFIWSMVSSTEKAFYIIDRSVVILMQSLYGTFVAFMTGVYVVISHKSLWAAIVVFVMCSFVVVAGNKTILFKILDKITPAGDQEHGDVEQGNAGCTCWGGRRSRKTE